MALIWHTDAQLRLFAKKILKKDSDFIFIDGTNTCTSTNDLRVGSVSNWGVSISKAGSILQWGFNLTSPNVSEQHLHTSVNWVRLNHIKCPADTPALNQLGTTRNTDISHDHDLLDDSRNETTTFGQPSIFMWYYGPAYLANLTSEIDDILQDVLDNVDDKDIRPLFINSAGQTPIYLNRLHQRQTPFYEPLGSTRLGRLGLV